MNGGAPGGVGGDQCALRASCLRSARASTQGPRPQWLVNAHEKLDHAVAAAYGWPEDISTEDALAKLLELNLRRSAS